MNDSPLKTVTINDLPLDTVTLLDKVTRVEVIDSSGRSYVNINVNNEVKISLQDNYRTLKIFIQNK